MKRGSNGAAFATPDSDTSSLVFAGSDKMFFIGTDGLIHGFIKLQDNDFGGSWFAYSPSIAVPPSQHVKAKSDLVASPDGTRLLYIGVDNYIYGFDILGTWTYSYISYKSASGSGYGFMRDNMIAEGLVAVSDLIYPGNDRIYYIGVATTIGGLAIGSTPLVYGFQNQTGIEWNTISPSSYANALYGPVPQFPAAGGLTYDWNKNRIYYRDTSGYLDYLEVRSFTYDYFYVFCPGNFQLDDQRLSNVGNLGIHYHDGKTIIYYVARYLPMSDDRIHCMVQEPGGAWHTNSPSYEATTTGTSLTEQPASDPNGYIAVSPDGNTIAYIGVQNSSGLLQKVICYFTNIDDVAYSFQKMAGFAVPGIASILTSLQFRDSADLYFASLAGVHDFKYQEDFCNNTGITEYLNYVPCAGNVPSAELIQDGLDWTIRLTFTDCGDSCNTWTLRYWQVGIGTENSRTIYRDCLHFPDIANVPVTPVPVARDSYISYQYQLLNCCGFASAVFNLN